MTTITIHLKKGKSFWEYVIMGVMAEKHKRLNMPVDQFSHVVIYDGGEYRYHTHPKKGVVSHPHKRRNTMTLLQTINIKKNDRKIQYINNKIQLWRQLCKALFNKPMCIIARYKTD